MHGSKKGGNSAKSISTTFSIQPLRSVQTLLWDEISSFFKIQEQDVVRSVLGNIRIDENELLFREVAALVEILQTVEEDMQQQLRSRQILDTPTHLMLERDICCLLNSLQTNLQFTDREDSSQSYCKPDGFEFKIFGNPPFVDRFFQSGFDIRQTQELTKSRGLKDAKDADSRESSIGWMKTGSSLQSTAENVRDIEGNLPNFSEKVHKLLKTREKTAIKSQLEIFCRKEEAEVDLDMAITFPNSPVGTYNLDLLNSLNLDSKCRSTVDYVMSKCEVQRNCISQSHSRCSSSLSRSSTDRSSLYKEDCFSRLGCATSSGASADFDPALVVESVAPFLNIDHVDAIVDKLQLAFSAENAALLKDVERLRSYLEESTSTYSRVKKNPPSLNDLKDCEKKLGEKLDNIKQSQTIQKVLAPQTQKKHTHSKMLGKLSESKSNGNAGCKLPKIGGNFLAGKSS